MAFGTYLTDDALAAQGKKLTGKPAEINEVLTRAGTDIEAKYAAALQYIMNGAGRAKNSAAASFAGDRKARTTRLQGLGLGAALGGLNKQATADLGQENLRIDDDANDRSAAVQERRMLRDIGAYSTLFRSASRVPPKQPSFLEQLGQAGPAIGQLVGGINWGSIFGPQQQPGPTLEELLAGV